MKIPLVVAGVLTLLSGGCSGGPQDIGREPRMTPVGAGLQVDRYQNIHYMTTPRYAEHANSTWRDSSVDMFRDPRAVRIGDVITVKISMKDKATIDNNTNRSRDSKRELNTALTYGINAFGFAKKGDATIDAAADGKTSTDSKGAIARSESIELLVAAVVTEVLPNGNLVISGTQEVRVNFEVRVLNVAGIVRPRDVSTDNSISYEKIAEARISYGGRGRITEVQQPAWGQQVIDILSPF